MDLKTFKQAIDKEIEGLKFPKNPEGLYNPIRYMLEGGGKRLRPILLLSFVKALGGNPADALNQAVALEIYHNFTLLHDDVMDRSELRHGRATVHKKWNEATAILSGDAMISIATLKMLEGLKEDKTRNVIELFHDAALKVDKGQQLDMDFENLSHVSLPEYEDMIMLKTGALFACATGIATLLALDTKQPGFKVLFKNATKFGYLLGVAFQLQDDLLDTYGDTYVFGKKIGGDIVNNKKTWLLINLLKSSLNKEANALIEDVNISADEKIKAVKQLYDKLRLKDKLEDVVRNHLDMLTKLLDEMSADMVPGGKELMEDYIKKIMMRES